MYKCICGASYSKMDAFQNLFKCKACGSRVHEFEQPTVGKDSSSRDVRGNGGSTDYYELPEGATELKDLIKHKQMEHGIGEAFCALYRLHDNGEYKRNLIKAKYYIECELEYYDKNK